MWFTYLRVKLAAMLRDDERGDLYFTLLHTRRMIGCGTHSMRRGEHVSGPGHV